MQRNSFFLNSENIMSQKVTKMLHDQYYRQNFTITIIDYQVRKATKYFVCGLSENSN